VRITTKLLKKNRRRRKKGLKKNRRRRKKGRKKNRRRRKKGRKKKKGIHAQKFRSHPGCGEKFNQKFAVRDPPSSRLEQFNQQRHDFVLTCFTSRHKVVTSSTHGAAKFLENLIKTRPISPHDFL
jgi:hypothetical protein